MAQILPIRADLGNLLPQQVPVQPTISKVTSLLPQQPTLGNLTPTMPPPRPQSAPVPLAPQLKPILPDPERQALQRHFSAMANTHQGLTHSATPAHGFWQKMGRIAEAAGNIAGDAFTPGLMMDIPGTQLNRAKQAFEGQQGLRQLGADEIAEQNANARTLDANSRAQDTADREFAMLNPPQKTEEPPHTLATDQGLFQWTNGEWQPVTSGGVTLKPPTKPETSPHDPFHEFMNDPENFQKFLEMEAAVKQKFASQHEKGSVMTPYMMAMMMREGVNLNPRWQPVFGKLIGEYLAKQGMPLTPDEQAAISSTAPNQPQDPETHEAIGLHMPGAPTGSTRTQAQTAQRVLIELPRIRKDMSSISDELGPAMGRWNDFMVGKVGNGDPRFEELRSDMQFVNSAAAKFHLNSVRAVEEFNKLAKTGRMTAPVLNGYLNAVQHWAQTAYGQELGSGDREAIGSGSSASGGAPKIGTVEGGYRYKGGDPAKSSSWEKVK